MIYLCGKKLLFKEGVYKTKSLPGGGLCFEGLAKNVVGDVDITVRERPSMSIPHTATAKAKEN